MRKIMVLALILMGCNSNLKLLVSTKVTSNPNDVTTENEETSDNTDSPDETSATPTKSSTAAPSSTPSSQTNSAPDIVTLLVVQSDQFSTVSGNILNSFDPLANDTNPTIVAPLAYTDTFPIITTQGGTVGLNNDQTLNYTPANGFVGSDSFIYHVRSHDGQTGQGTISITVTGQLTVNANSNLIRYYQRMVDSGAPLPTLSQELASSHPNDPSWVKLKATHSPIFPLSAEYRMFTSLGSDAQMRTEASNVINGNLIYTFGGVDTYWAAFNDIIAYDMASGRTISIFPHNNGGIGVAGTNFPEARMNSSMTYANGALYVFGGRIPSQNWAYANDMWKFDLTSKTWTKLIAAQTGAGSNVTFPSGRTYAQMQSWNGNLYIIGGSRIVNPYGYHNDVWKFDLTLNQFQLVKANGNGGVGVAGTDFPSEGKYSSVIYQNKIVFISTNVSKVWAFDLQANAFVLLKDPASVGGAVADVDYPTISWNLLTLVLSGNSFYLTSTSTYAIWRYDLTDNTFHRIKDYSSLMVGAGITFPQVRRDPILGIYNNKYFTIGGFEWNNGTPFYDVWSYDLTSNIDTKLAGDEISGWATEGTTYPGPRVEAQGLAVGRKIYMVNGWDPAYTDLLEVWEYNIDTHLFTKIFDPTSGCVNVGDCPAGNWEAPIAYYNNRIYIFGPAWSETSIWYFDLTTKRYGLEKGNNNAPDGGTADIDYPRNRYYSKIVASSDGKIYLTGGQNSSYIRYSDMWEYNISTKHWTKRFAQYTPGDPGLGTTIPYGRIQNVFHLDETNNRLIIACGMYDGNGSSSGPISNDVWSFDLTNNTYTRLYGRNNDNVGTMGVTYPEGRREGAYTVINNKIYYFSGELNGWGNTNDIWTFDLTAKTWNQEFSVDNNGNGVPNVDFPSSRTGTQFAFADNSLFVYGGYNSDPWYFGKDYWQIDLNALSPGKTNRALLAFDVTPPSGSPGNQGQLDIKAFAKGDDGNGNSIGGLNVYQWNPSTSSFVMLFSNVATSRAGASWTGSVNLTYKDGQNKIYLLFQGTPTNTAAQPAVFDIDLSAIQLTVPYE